MKPLLIAITLLATATSGFVTQATFVRKPSLKMALKNNDKQVSAPLVSRALEGCTLGEGVIECDTESRSCSEYEIEHCQPVYCINSYACHAATILDSSVFCQEGRSCESATITDSSVTCATTYSCYEANIFRSNLVCGDALNSCQFAKLSAVALTCNGGFQSCEWMTFNDQCSCCDGSACPDELDRCTVNGAPSEEFCSKQSNGVTCAALGNPICSDMPTYTPPQASPTPTPAVSSPQNSPTSASPQDPAPTPLLSSTSTEPPTPTSTGLDTSAIAGIAVALIAGFCTIIAAII